MNVNNSLPRTMLYANLSKAADYNNIAGFQVMEGADLTGVSFHQNKIAALNYIGGRQVDVTENFQPLINGDVEDYSLNITSIDTIRIAGTGSGYIKIIFSNVR